MSAPAVVEVGTPEGPGRLHIDPADDPRGVLVLGHGAGGGVGAADLELLARRLPATGVTVARFEQPWRVAGRRVAVPPPRLDLAWRAALEAARPTWAGLPLVVGGRSAGARVACRTAEAVGAVGVVCLAFPLHLPGRTGSRAGELNAPSVPRLVLQGTRDAFGTATEVRAAAGPGVEVVELAGADHGFRVPRQGPLTAAELREAVVGAVTDRLAALLGPAAAGAGERGAE